MPPRSNNWDCCFNFASATGVINNDENNTTQLIVTESANYSCCELSDRRVNKNKSCTVLFDIWFYCYTCNLQYHQPSRWLHVHVVATTPSTTLHSLVTGWSYIVHWVGQLQLHVPWAKRQKHVFYNATCIWQLILITSLLSYQRNMQLLPVHATSNYM